MPTDPSRVSEIRDFRPGGLHPANRGDVLNGRYKICFPHSAAWSGESFTYVVKVQDTSMFCCLRILSADSSSSDAAQQYLEIQERFSTDIEKARQYLFLPLDYFWAEGPNGKHLALRFELFGYDYSWFMEYHYGPVVMPASILKKTAKDVLEALHYLHEHGIVHGGLESSALIMTYPDLESQNESKVEEFFGWKGEEKPFEGRDDVPVESKPKGWAGLGLSKLNETGTGPQGSPMSLSFRYKLCSLGSAYPLGTGSGSLKPFQSTSCPPPEILFNEQPGFATDIWYLGMTLLRITAPTHHSEPFAPLGDRLQAILGLRDIIGDLPARYKEKLNPTPEDPDYYDDELHEAIFPPYLDEYDEAKHWGPGEQEAWVGLLRGMLRWLPSERVSAKTAAQSHIFTT